MPTYPVVFFDLDHTLFDFEASKAAAFDEVLRRHGHDDPAALLDTFASVEGPLWAQLEAGALTLDTLNVARFEGLAAAADLDVDPVVVGAEYLDGLGRHGGLFPGARALLGSVSQACASVMVSNGYASVQRARIENFDLGSFFDAIVISDEIRIAKPDPRFFDHAMAAAGQPERASVLVVGDSLTSDIEGARRAGLASCWYNPHGKPIPDDPPIDHVVTELAEIAPIVLGT